VSAIVKCLDSDEQMIRVQIQWTSNVGDNFVGVLFEHFNITSFQGNNLNLNQLDSSIIFKFLLKKNIC
jgi:hypothetical protein